MQTRRQVNRNPRMINVKRIKQTVYVPGVRMYFNDARIEPKDFVLTPRGRGYILEPSK